MNCKSCGEKIDAGSKFCPKCGANNQELGKDKAIASLVIGIISLFFGTFFIPLPIIGLALGCAYKGKCAEKTAGIILNTISLIFALLSIIFIVIFGVFLGITLVEKGINSFDFDGVNIHVSTNWEQYSSYVDSNDQLDNTTTLIGQWKELADKRSYVVFEEENYYFVSDMNDKDARYDTGTYSVKTFEDTVERIGIKNKMLNRFFEKLIVSLDETNMSLLRLDTMESYVRGDIVDNNLTDENRYSLVIIESHDGVVELILSDFKGEGEKHYYKVQGSTD